MRGSYWEPVPAGAAGGLFHQIGPCCRLGGSSVVVAVTRADVVRVRLERSGFMVAAADTVADPATPWVRFAVLGAPLEGSVRVVFELADGTTAAPLADPLNLARAGG